MKNVTITLDEETAAWVRVHAARHETSVSRIVGEMLREKMQDARAYDSAMRRFLARPARPLSAPGQPLPARDDVHDRAGLR
ncbi:MAG TPA: CopG family transcriptional regulator [Burkholderiaceae bacterium]